MRSTASSGSIENCSHQPSKEASAIACMHPPFLMIQSSRTTWPGAPSGGPPAWSLRKPMNRKLVIIEPWFHKTNPSWESLIRALPYLQTGGYEVIVWCWTCDPHPLVKPIIFRRRKVAWVLEPWLFAFQAHWRRFVVEAGSWKDVCDVSISNGFDLHWSPLLLPAIFALRLRCKTISDAVPIAPRCS